MTADNLYLKFRTFIFTRCPKSPPSPMSLAPHLCPHAFTYRSPPSLSRYSCRSAPVIHGGGSFSSAIYTFWLRPNLEVRLAYLIQSHSMCSQTKSIPSPLTPTWRSFTTDTHLVASNTLKMTRFPNFFASLLVAILALTTSARSERHCGTCVPSFATALASSCVLVRSSTQSTYMYMQWSSTPHLSAHCTFGNLTGIALSTGHDPHLYYAWETRQVLQTMRLRRATDVQISAYSKQIGLNATTAKLVTNKAALAYIFQLAHQIGLRVFFKPVVEVETARGGYEWRGRIPGSVAWFNQVYIPFIVDMARLAQAHKLDSFAVGSEYDATVNSTQLWLRVIQSVRAVYTGKLTYIGNHDVSAPFSVVKLSTHLACHSSPWIMTVKRKQKLTGLKHPICVLFSRVTVLLQSPLLVCARLHFRISLLPSCSQKCRPCPIL